MSAADKSSPLDKVLADIANHRPFAVFDAGGPEFIAIIAIPADAATEADLTLLRDAGRGPVSLMMSKRRLEELGFVSADESGDMRPITSTASVNLRGRRGITVRDQMDAVRALSDPASQRADFVEPGTVVAFACDDLGILGKRRAAVAARDLVDAAGLYPAALTSPVLNDEGGLAGPDFVAECLMRESIRAVSIDDVIALQWKRKPVITMPVGANLPTAAATFRFYASRSVIDGAVVGALVHGTPTRSGDTLVHVHRGDILSDVFGDGDDAAGKRLRTAIAAIAKARAGILVYLNSEAANSVSYASANLHRPLSAGEIGLAAQMVHLLNPRGPTRFEAMSVSESVGLSSLLDGMQLERAAQT
jgi:3,4-dihydroxy 2-butanone 4-phosphate synthase/GTP cyclohydrolase II